jgi:flagellar hook-basal body complex protein FliE
MTAPIGALSALSGLTPVTPPVTPAATQGTSGTDFAQELSKGLDNLQGLQGKADTLAVQAATGSLTDVHDYTIAATEASLATQLTVAVRNKAVDAFNEIMRIPA